MRVPEGARTVIGALKKAGYEAYLVGGCVRDALLSVSAEDVEPHDWDICTNARPDEMKAVFAGGRTIGTGLRHGTLTVLMPDGPYEVTAYRIDGTYSDGRRPDSVTFTAELTEDLARRDFTINAMAMGVDGEGNTAEVIDPFGGREDLARRVLRCVGEANVRFEEDALRILRALRFASRLGLAIDPATCSAMLEKRALLRRISAERTMDELGKTLLTERGWAYFLEYRDILTEIVPELAPCVGFEQRNPWHCYDVFEHSLRSVGYAPPDLTLRMTMLLHDVGKPAAASVDETGVGHFYGHAEVSAAMAEKILTRLHCSHQLTRDVTELIRFHDAEAAPSARTLRRLLNKLGPWQLQRLLRVKRADTLAQSELHREERLHELDESEALLARILTARQAFSLQDLAINGEDLIAHGVVPGPALGARLQRALDAVLDGTAENDRDTLLQIALETQKTDEPM
ncbi:MAG: HD domain-containing protein [Ruminococcaceae bacterium]|nr:HD domain-containing protein [Oscillospiraceae bacterium]